MADNRTFSIRGVDQKTREALKVKAAKVRITQAELMAAALEGISRVPDAVLEEIFSGRRGAPAAAIRDAITDCIRKGVK